MARIIASLLSSDRGMVGVDPPMRSLDVLRAGSSPSRHELSPRQLRNIEGATSAAEVLDRTGVIIEIFHLPEQASLSACHPIPSPPRQRSDTPTSRCRGNNLVNI